MANSRTIESPHFRLQELAEGVYAALQKDGGWAIANAGIVDLGGETLVFDTFMTPEAAADLREAAEKVTGRPPTYVINSHYHNDHTWGNQVFEDATFISSGATRKLLQTKGKEEVEWFSKQGEDQLHNLTAQFESESSREERTKMLPWLAYYQGIVATMPALRVRLPDITFAERMSLYGSLRSVELHAFSGGHTGSDTVLVLPDSGIVFMADLLFVNCHPYLADGDPQKTLESLDRISAMEAGILVPGHGEAGSADDIRRMKAYISELDELARARAEAGEPVEAMNTLAIPSEYEAWGMPQFFTANLGFLWQRHQQEYE